MKCPNCNGDIGRFELSPNCKHCGVNIFYFQQEKLLSEDAKKCELEYASFRILSSKIKTAFIGGIIPIFRLVAMVVAIACICIPFATVSVNLPLLNAEFSFGAIGIYQAFSDGTLNVILSIKEYMGDVTYICLALLLLMVLIFLCGLGIFLTLILSFINIRKTAKIMKGFSVVGLIFSISGIIVSFVLPNIINGFPLFESSVGFGSFACALIFIITFILNHLVIIKNIEPEIKEVDILRVEMRKKVKSGEVSLSELPLPVFESEEERDKRLEAEKLSRELAEKARGGESLE